MIGLSLLLMGCQPAAPRYLAQPQQIEVVGDWRHDPSGMVFPAVVAGFNRVDIAHFSATKPDVAAAYNLSGAHGPIAATVYIAPAMELFTVGMATDAVAAARDRACDVDFDGQKRDILNHTMARTLAQKNVALRKSGRLRPGRQAIFAYQAVFAGQRQNLQTELDSFCFVTDDWSIEFRFTYPETMAAEGRIAGFLQALPWTGQIAD